jgi:hypothetical protein
MDAAGPRVFIHRPDHINLLIRQSYFEAGRQYSDACG